ncbi:hypothetical protein [Natronolimnobius baerhuensis]|uniref:Uncharacterized protein n=1 Tax=Natronolimnobius baerhuensis TaxID=253108 RepID=A0A202E6V7_9EURY|nr:hypothetical protein [Natronolimnobius baerhuensis]OVE83993.1 hypothetical protein B2G88_13130 [Natronolimnobius baerhuensis]
MNRPSPPHRGRRERALIADLETLDRRLAALEREQRLVRNTLCGIAREIGPDVVIGSVCSHCSRSYVLITDGMLYCPKCKHRRTV